MDFKGPFPEGFDHGEFSARRQAARLELAITWEELCSQAGVGVEAAIYAVRGCEFDVRPHLPVIKKLLRVFNRDLQWLLTGNPTDTAFSISLREEKRQLVELYAYRGQIPTDDQAQ